MAEHESVDRGMPHRWRAPFPGDSPPFLHLALTGGSDRHEDEEKDKADKRTCSAEVLHGLFDFEALGRAETQMAQEGPCAGAELDVEARKGSVAWAARVQVVLCRARDDREVLCESEAP